MDQELPSATTSEASKSGPINGEITDVLAGHVNGVVSGIEPKAQVALLIEGRRIASTDLHRTGPGPLYAFSFDATGCPASLLEKRDLKIEIALLGRSLHRFASKTIPSREFFKHSDLPGAPKTSSFEGCIDGWEDGLLRGWVWDREVPTRQLDLLVFIEGCFVGKFRATQPRPDLAASGRGNGNYGFAIRLSRAVMSSSASAPPLVAVVDKKGAWPVPTGTHALAGPPASRPSKLRGLPSTVEEFTRILASTDPFPKKIFVINKIKHGAMPDAFKADYVFLALECIRHEMVALGESMTGMADWRQRLRVWLQMRALGVRIRRLEELAKTIALGPDLLKASSRTLQHEEGDT